MNPQDMKLAAFKELRAYLLARIEEDLAVARRWIEEATDYEIVPAEMGEHFARFKPDLAELDLMGRRDIVEHARLIFGGARVLRALAQPYYSRDDFRADQWM